MQVFQTDVLVVGAGPAGLTAAAFLARYNIAAITVTRYNGTANSPRAHITNQRTVEVLRDLGIEDEMMAEAMPQDLMGTQVFATAFAGEELCRMMTWGAGIDRKAEYVAASPSSMCNMPQHLLEPMIRQAAERHGADMRFGAELTEIRQDANIVIARILERATGREYEIHAKYAIGCDGARSIVAEQIGFEIEGAMGLGEAFTVWLDADLSRYTKHRSGALFFVCEPGSDVWLSAWTCVKPWTEWNPLFLRFSLDSSDISEDEVLKRVRSAIGDPSVAVKIKKISTWKINHAVAAGYRIGRVFLAGDAAHRHPPANGLGSNTCIQDSYDLAWKLAFVLSGRAGEGLLETYNAERQPVGRQVVDRANKSVAELGPWATALGLKAGQTKEEAWANLDELYGPTETGARRRHELIAGLKLMDWQFNAIGVELGQRYQSKAVVSDGTPFPAYDRDPELHYHPTTHPGAYLPHVWLEHEGRKLSTLDLTRSGRFALITGIGGDAWIKASQEASGELGVEIASYKIGPRQTYNDPLGEWTRRREIEDTGCILVRPDGYVGWRSMKEGAAPTSELRKALKAILDR
ncbi:MULTISPECIES: FAD-dependent monooxygenase [unclassified Bradyrhizobium]|uniref:FAD-dependent monooxygenase n=1 Tax=unclassified Bradyrhizobium TaxID=2631580 RepID=UPI0033993DCE